MWSLLSKEWWPEQAHPLYEPACSHYWLSEPLWGRIYEDFKYFLEYKEGEINKLTWWEKSHVVITVYFPLALITAPEYCTLWQCPPELLVHMQNLRTDIQKFSCAQQQLWHHSSVHAGVTQIAVVKLMFKTLKALPANPPESLCCFSWHHFSPSCSQPTIYANKAFCHCAASWVFAVSSF